MLTPESPGPNDVPSGGRVVWLDGDAIENLFPGTTIDHLLSEKERQKAEHERKEFEALGRRMDLIETEQVLYSLCYDSAVSGWPLARAPKRSGRRWYCFRIRLMKLLHPSCDRRMRTSWLGVPRDSLHE